MDEAANTALVVAAKNLVEKGRLNFGFGDDAGERYLRMATTPDSQAHLMGAIAGSVRDPQFFAQKRKLLEVGCGGASFLYSALTRGHDANGIDNDPERLAVAWAKIAAFGYPPEWRGNIVLGDAGEMPIPSNSFDLVLGHQFIEHVANVPGIISELLRVTRPGGYVVLYAPDYRGPFEAHYEMPWPPFATPRVATRWVEHMGRPVGGIGTFHYVTLPQVYAVFEILDCDIVGATLDRPIDPVAIRMFDDSSDASLQRTAETIRRSLEAGTLPPQFAAPTSFSVAARKR